MIPTVIEKSGRTDYAYDIYSRLLKDRIIIVNGSIDEHVAASICAQLLYLESQDENREICLYVNSPGGSVTDGLAIFDTMRFIASPVATVCMGMAASMGAFLLAAGEPGRRFSLPNSEIMIHQPLGGFHGQATDIEIHARNIIQIKERLNRIMALNTGKDYEEIVRLTERDNFLTPEEALDLGIIDRVLTSRADIARTEGEMSS